MGIQKIILNIFLKIGSSIMKMLKIKKNRITFISLESNQLTSDFKLIYDQLDQSQYDIRLCLIHYHKDLIGQFFYFLNCIKQLYYVYTSHLIILNNNNYVVSHFKRNGVVVLQLWHACGAIKKFGNAIERKYSISNYDYVLSTSKYWKIPYSQAFGVNQENVLPLGMPRNDELFNEEKKKKYRDVLYKKYPMLKNKKIILYAPTFRGNIYKGFYDIPFDALKIIQALDDDYVILYKYHPLLGNRQLCQHDRIINMNNEDTHQLFCITDYLVSDYSSIVFDYMILQKPLLFFVPDLEDYEKDLGVFVNIRELGCPICQSEKDIINFIQNPLFDKKRLSDLKNIFFDYQDDRSTQRVVDCIEQLIEQ